MVTVPQFGLGMLHSVSRCYIMEEGNGWDNKVASVCVTRDLATSRAVIIARSKDRCLPVVTGIVAALFRFFSNNLTKVVGHIHSPLKLLFDGLILFRKFILRTESLRKFIKSTFRSNKIVFKKVFKQKKRKKSTTINFENNRFQTI